MLSIVRLVGSLAIALLLALQPAAGLAWTAGPGSVPAGGVQPPEPVSVGLERDFGQLPLYFVENQGQLEQQVAYYVQGQDKTLYFTPEGMTIALSAPLTPTLSLLETERDPGVAPAAQRWVVKLDFLGANPEVRPEGLERTEAVISYFRGSPDEWHTGLPTYSRIIYRELWPGIDLVYQGTVNRLKYEFVVHPGADPAQIRLAYRGASGVWLDEGGQLQVSTPLGSYSDEAPVAYQEGERGQRFGVTVTYTAPEEQGGAYSYGFRVGAYDRSKPLVLDPAVLLYCGYIGGSFGDVGYGIAVDGAGSAYVTGATSSSEATFPEAAGPDLSHNGGSDAFVAKMNAEGTALLYCGYIGGSGTDEGRGIAVDGAGNAYIAGGTQSSETTFPVGVGPDPTHNGDNDAFVAKVDAAGTALLYCGYIGGSGNDYGIGIAVDSSGNAYVSGWTYSSEATFPAAVGPDLTHNGDNDAFVAKVNAEGTALLYCGYIGGSGTDFGYGIAVDGEGNAYVAGYTISSESTFPETVGPDPSHNGDYDAFIAKVDAAGTTLLYCGYIGGSGTDSGYGVAVDGSGSVYVTGYTYSSETTFPVTVGPDLGHNGSKDAFVAKVNAAGTALDYCGYIGGSGTDDGYGIAVDGEGNAYVVGYTSSNETTFPVTVGPDLSYNGKDSDAFVVKLNAAGTALSFCGYIGGNSTEWGWDIAVDGVGNAYVTGWTYSNQATFPVAVGPDLSHNGSIDAFVAKIGEPTPLNLSATAVSTTQIDLAWVDNSPDESEFRIERSPDGSTGWTEVGTLEANQTSYSDTGLICETTYYYRVRAYRADDGQYSGYSNVAYATTETCPTAVSLTSFTATGARRAINLEWATANEIDNLGFNLYRATKVDGRKTKINREMIPSEVYPGCPYGAIYTYADTAVKKGKTYYYWLEDVDIYGHTELHGPVGARPDLER